SAGKAFLQLFLTIQREHQQFLQQINQRLSENTEIVFLLKRLIMKASARNQFFGKISAISTGSIDVEVTINLKGGETLIAAITKTSAVSLGIKNGLDVVALIKAPQVILITDFDGYRLSARNQLKGLVSRIQKGSVNADVVLELPGGDSVAATITNDSIDKLGLAIGGTATAVFKPGAVILGVAS
ncbi:MAG: TOBE domain-containing protein, partial [Methylococcales bacterium]